mmetsp:Transcript_30295/g.72053  ORF Transcript_30295/g.72053 Transcript_30295/m.72053 type:complete len:300 (-) Transcript_30295:241-1140(-)
MSSVFDKLSQVANKIEKAAPIRLTEKEKKILSEIEAQVSELSSLQNEFDEQLDGEDEGAAVASLGYDPVPEDADNMAIEKLAEMLRNEAAQNAFMIENCRNFVIASSTLLLQRVFRGHVARNQYKVIYGVYWGRRTEETSLVLQAAYRGMVGRREARKYAQAEKDLDRISAAVQVQRIVRGNRNRKMVAGMKAEIKKTDKAFFSSKGRTEADLFRKRNHLGGPDDEDDTSSDSHSDDGDTFINTRHPTTGCRLTEAPQYGKALGEKRQDYHYPKVRAPAEDSFDEDSSDENDAAGEFGF